MKLVIPSGKHVTTGFFFFISTWGKTLRASILNISQNTADDHRKNEVRIVGDGFGIPAAEALTRFLGLHRREHCGSEAQ